MPTITPILYTSKTLKDGSHPIYFRLRLHNKQHYLPIYKNDNRFRANLKQWDKDKRHLVRNKKFNTEYEIINDILVQREYNLRSIIEEKIRKNETLNIKHVRNQFYQESLPTNVMAYIGSMIISSNPATASNLKNLQKTLTQFNNDHDLSFDEVDYDYVTELIRFHEFKGHNKTSIGISLRYLRSVLNHGIKNDVGNQKNYPFSNKYGATQVINIAAYEKQERKLAIDLNLINRLKEKQFDNTQTEMARRLFIASYAGRGINFRDLAKLTTDNIYTFESAQYIQYNRNKTGASINFKISPVLHEQLQWFKTNCQLHKNFLFPIINHECTDEYIFLRNKLNSFNYRLKIIAKELKINQNELTLSSYTARHSFATNLYHNGVDVNKISQALSHNSITTTKAYLGRFQEDKLSLEIERITG